MKGKKENLIKTNNDEIVMIHQSKLKSFDEQPYKVLFDESMDELVESIKKRGLIQPVLVRPIGNDMYEMVSGHRRKRAFEKAGIESIPARVQDLTLDEAILSMVDSNLQRDEILPSEKAFATVNDSPEAVTFSWEISTVPVNVEGLKPTATVVIDSTKCDAEHLAAIEAKLFGTESEESTLLLPDEIKALMN